MAGWIVVFVYLFMMAVYDIRKREISLKVSVVAAIILLVRMMWFIGAGNWQGIASVTGFLVGVFVLGISIISRDQIGIGDGILFIVSGLLLGMYENIILLFLALVMSAVIGGGLLIFRRVGRKDKLPFAPFVFAGYGVMCLWKLMG